jgi:DNA helicase IV
VAEDRELLEEQALLDRAHDALDSMRTEARQMLESVLDLGRGGTFQSRTERDIVVRTSLARLAQLDIGDQGLCFGRIDRKGDDEHPEGETFHIGRVAVSGTDHEPLVVDWRAPVAAPFYRATGLDPQGLVRRRHLAVRGRSVVGYEDEVFEVAPGHPSPAPSPAHDDLVDSDVPLGGPAALMAALGQARTGRMSDIVATIQREQDEIIRAPLAGLLLVQGGPGTGKTAVALHRAAYLLYTHRFPLERQGVLVVGPNPLFLRYIEQVLPSLGETGVTLSTVSGLVSELRIRGTDSAEAARIKGEARMAKVVAQAVRTRERRLSRPLEVPFGATVLRLDVAESARIVRSARRRPGTHNAKRRFVEREVTVRLAERYEAFQEAADERNQSALGQILPALEADEPAEAAESSIPEWRTQLRRLPAVREALDRMWPRLAPHELIHDLFGAPALLAAAAEGVLDRQEQALLVRPRSPSLDQVSWTAADAALVDEARAVLGPSRPRPRNARGNGRNRGERPPEDVAFWPSGLDVSPEPTGPSAVSDDVRSFGHIVVDEAQDLSPMQLRMLARRSISGSMTVVGDIAQATGSWAPLQWSEVIAHLSPRRPATMVELSVSYRTPAEVMAIAARVLHAAVPSLAPPRPVRRSGAEPQILHAPRSDLGARVAEAATEQLATLDPGRIAVLAPSFLLAELDQDMRERGLSPEDPRDPDGPGLGAPLVLLPATEANGLEFDGVIVVEPARVVDEPVPTERPSGDRRGLRTLYVALTRPTQRLSVVHSLPLPVPLR